MMSFLSGQPVRHPHQWTERSQSCSKWRCCRHFHLSTSGVEGVCVCVCVCASAKDDVFFLGKLSWSISSDHVQEYSRLWGWSFFINFFKPM